MLVYTDRDTIGKVHQSNDHGAINIEVKSTHSIGEESKAKNHEIIKGNYHMNPVRGGSTVKSSNATAKT